MCAVFRLRLSSSDLPIFPTTDDAYEKHVRRMKNRNSAGTYDYLIVGAPLHPPRDTTKSRQALIT